LAPLLPGLSSSEEQLRSAVQAAKEHGARFLWTELLRLDRGVREHYLRFVSEQFPELLGGYLKLYSGKSAPGAYAARVYARAERLKREHGLADRGTPAPAEPHQLCLL